MSGYRVDAVIIKSQPLGEADRLVTSYTRQRGRHRAVARGARRSRSRLGACLQPFVHAQLYCWKGRSLDGISQCAVQDGFAAVRESLSGAAAAAYMCELVDGLTQEADPDPHVFDLFLMGLHTLNETVAHEGGEVPVAWPQDGPLERLLLAFQWKLLTLKGFGPSFDRCAACGRRPQGGALPAKVHFSPGEGGLLCRPCRGAGNGTLYPARRDAVTAIDTLIRQPLTAAVGLAVPPGAVKDLFSLSHTYLTWVLERPLQSTAFLEVLGTGAK